MTIQSSLKSIKIKSSRGDIIFTELNKPFILYFYPKDNTPGCTDESQQFARLYEQFKSLGYEIFGVSRDSLASHEKFINNFNLPFILLSDDDEKLCQAFDVIKEKKNFGKTYLGIERSTFIIDEHLNLIKEWRKVKVADHAQAVLDFIQNLK